MDIFNLGQAWKISSGLMKLLINLCENPDTFGTQFLCYYFRPVTHPFILIYFMRVLFRRQKVYWLIYVLYPTVFLTRYRISSAFYSNNHPCEANWVEDLQLTQGRPANIMSGEGFEPGSLRLQYNRLECYSTLSVICISMYAALGCWNEERTNKLINW